MAPVVQIQRCCLHGSIEVRPSGQCGGLTGIDVEIETAITRGMFGYQSEDRNYDSE